MSSAFGAAFGGFFPRRSTLFTKKPRVSDEVALLYILVWRHVYLRLT